MTRPLWILVLLVVTSGCGGERRDLNPARSTDVVAEANTPAIGADSRLVQSVGLETLGGVFTTLLPSGTVIPCEISQVFSTAVDEQDQITITVYRGTGDLVADNSLIGRFRITDFRKAPRGVPKVEVRFIAAGRDLRILATDGATGRACSIDRLE